MDTTNAGSNRVSPFVRTLVKLAIMVVLLLTVGLSIFGFVFRFDSFIMKLNAANVFEGFPLVMAPVVSAIAIFIAAMLSHDIMLRFSLSGLVRMLLSVVLICVISVVLSLLVTQAMNLVLSIGGFFVKCILAITLFLSIFMSGWGVLLTFMNIRSKNSFTNKMIIQGIICEVFSRSDD